jgi:N-acetylglucosamine-6-phosphate deacetylase
VTADDARRLVIEGARTPAGETLGPLRVVDGIIVAIGDDAAMSGARGRRFDADGLIVAPGFIEVQVNGAGGHDITADPSSMWAVGECLVEFGVTSFLPTVVSSRPEIRDSARRVLLGGPKRGFRGAAAVGLHFEGPFLNVARRGAHEASQLRAPDGGLTAQWSPQDGVRVVTLAPELPGALDVARELVRRGVVVSAGHSLATAEEARRGFDAGIRYATHLFNAMPPLDHRAPGLAGAALADPRVTVGLIVDGHHVDPLVVSLAWRLLGASRLNVVSDGIAALGMEPGAYRLGDATMLVDDDRAGRLPDGRLAGGATGLDEAVRNLVTFTGATSADALATVTSTPASLLGLEDRGRIAVGMRADIVLLTPGLRVVATIVGGDLVHATEDRLD